MEEKEKAEKALKIITESLKKEDLRFSENIADGRILSAVEEKDAKEKIQKIAKGSDFFKDNKLRVSDPNTGNNRAWYDFAIEWEDGFFVPVNIKITRKRSADNLSCKLGIFYALTGILPDDAGLKNGTGWADFADILSKNLKKEAKKTGRDYYFLVISKEDTKDIFFSSLKTLQRLVPNANNLPFQCCWKENEKRKERTAKEAKEFVLGALKKSLLMKKQEVLKTCAALKF